MDALKEHNIPFTGLKDGRHEYQFELGPEFFAAAGEEEFLGGQALVDVALDKTPTMLVANIHVDGIVQVLCDRCNTPMDQAIKGDQRQIFQLFDDGSPEDDELVVLDPREHSINVTHYIYECMRLALPIRHVHPPGQCDPEVEAALQRLATEPEHTPDPRWDALKDLKNTRP